MIREDSIRPKDLDKGKNHAILEDIKWLKGRFSDFETVPCPACAGVKSVPAYEKFGFTFELCSNCRTAFMNPRADQQTLSEFYSRSKVYEYWDEFVFPATRDFRKQNIFRPRVSRILERLANLEVEPGTLVDVGAAGGMF